MKKVLTVISILIAIQLPSNCVTVPVQTELDKSLFKIYVEEESLKHHDMKMLEERYLELLKSHPDPRDAGKIYGNLAIAIQQFHLTRSTTNNPDAERKKFYYANKALACPLEVPDASRQYVLVSEALCIMMPKPGSKEFVSARHEGIIMALKGIRLLVENGIPRDTLHNVCLAAQLDGLRGGEYKYDEIFLKCKKELGLDDRAMKFRGHLASMIGDRGAMTGFIKIWYRNRPDNLDEIKKLALSIVKDKVAVDEIIAEVEGKISFQEY